MTRMLAEQCKPERHRVLAGLMRQHVDHHFTACAVCVWPTERHHSVVTGDCTVIPIHREVRDVIGHVGRALDHGGVDPFSSRIIASNGEPMMKDCPMIFCSQPTIVPDASEGPARMR